MAGVRARKRAKGGRPTKLTAALIKRIEKYIKRGNYVETAAAAAGVARSTLYDWLRRGARAETGLHRELVDVCTKAMAIAETDRVNVMRTAADRNWVAAAWWLERKHPDRWGRRDRRPAPDPDLLAFADDPAIDLADEIKSGDLGAVRRYLAEAIARGVLALPGAIEHVGPGQLAYFVRSLGGLQEQLGGAKLVHPQIQVFLGRPPPSRAGDVPAGGDGDPDGS